MVSSSVVYSEEVCVSTLIPKEESADRKAYCIAAEWQVGSLSLRLKYAYCTTVIFQERINGEETEKNKWL